MKKSFLALALLVAVPTFAQVSPGDVSGEQGAPAGVNFLDAIRPLWSRIHTLEIDHKVYLMKKNGITQSQFAAGFSASGALLYDHEMAGKGIFNDKSIAGRNAGFQVIPYTISLTEDNRVFVSTSALGWKNMNSEMADRDLFLSSSSGQAFNIIDNIEIAKFEYSKNHRFDNVEELHFKAVQIDAKLNLMPDVEGQYFAAKAGAAPVGYHKTTVTLLTNDRVTMEGFESSIRYGMGYNANMKKGWRVNAEIMAGNNWSMGDRREFVENQDGTTSEYKPSRSYFYVAPKVEVSKKISKTEKSPVRLGLRFSGNFQVSDEVKTKGQSVDMKSINGGQLLNTGLYLNF